MKRDGDAVGVVLLIVGGIMLLTRRSNQVDWGGGWTFPVPDLVLADGTGTWRAVVSQAARVGAGHNGVDVMYRRSETGGAQPAAFAQEQRTPGGYWAPAGAPVLAARAGKVWSVDRQPRGWAVVVDHGPPWATAYFHLETPSVTRGQSVLSGEQIGTMGADPTDGQRVRHLHFEAWYKGAAGAAVDPAAAMATWARVAWDGVV